MLPDDLDYSALLDPRYAHSPDSPWPVVLRDAAASSAGEVLKRLQGVFNRFAATLAANEEIGVALASFGAQHTVRVESVKALGPNLILISGFEDDCPVELVQHVTQLSFLLIRLKSSAPDGAPRRTIGFYSE